ncbi:unnamed protein product, partial [Prorocentrum cordatum]
IRRHGPGLSIGVNIAFGAGQAAVADVAKETGLNPDRAADFADRILHVVADLQNDNVAHAKKLVDHLVKEGTKGEKLERHAEEHLLAQVAEEVDHIGEDMQAGIAQEVEDASVGAGGAGAMEPADADERDPLRAVLQGIWSAFEDYEVAFGGKIRQSFQNGSLLYKELAGLQHKIATWKIFPPTEKDREREARESRPVQRGPAGRDAEREGGRRGAGHGPRGPERGARGAAGEVEGWQGGLGARAAQAPGAAQQVHAAVQLAATGNRSRCREGADPSEWLEQKVERERLDAASAAPPRGAAAPAAAEATPG